MSKIQDLFVREKDGYFECVFCQTSFFTLIMFKFHLQTKHASVTQPVELQDPSHIQPPVENSENNKTTNSEKLPKLQNSSLLETVVANNTTKKSEKLPIIVEKQNTYLLVPWQPKKDLPRLLKFESCTSALSNFGHSCSHSYAAQV